jgi:hypothetical protein
MPLNSKRDHKDREPKANTPKMIRLRQRCIRDVAEAMNPTSGAKKRYILLIPSRLGSLAIENPSLSAQSLISPK